MNCPLPNLNLRGIDWVIVAASLALAPVLCDIGPRSGYPRFM